MMLAALVYLAVAVSGSFSFPCSSTDNTVQFDCQNNITGTDDRAVRPDVAVTCRIICQGITYVHVCI